MTTLVKVAGNLFATKHTAKYFTKTILKQLEFMHFASLYCYAKSSLNFPAKQRRYQKLIACAMSQLLLLYAR